MFRVVQERSICQDFVIDDGAAFVGAVSPSEAVFALVLTPADDPLVVPAEIASFVEGFEPGIVSVAEPIDATGYAQASVRWTEEVPAENTANIAAKIMEDHGRFASAAPKSRPAYQVVEVVAPGCHCSRAVDPAFCFGDRQFQVSRQRRKPGTPPRGPETLRCMLLRPRVGPGTGWSLERLWTPSSAPDSRTPGS